MTVRLILHIRWKGKEIRLTLADLYRGTRMRTRGKTMAEGIFSCKIREKAKEKEEKGRIKSGRKRV